MKQKTESDIETLVRRYHAPLYALARRLLGDPDVAADCVQEVFIKLLSCENEIIQAENEKAFVLTVATRHALNDRRATERRKLRQQQWSDENIDDPSSESKTADEEFLVRRRIETGLQDLSPMQRGVLVLRFYHDLTLAEVAEVVGCSLSSARVHLARALESMRNRLDCKSDEVVT